MYFTSKIKSYDSKNVAVVQVKGRHFSLPSHQCGICADRDTYLMNKQLSDNTAEFSKDSLAIITPYETTCGHVYCYFCITEQLIRAADEGHGIWYCLRCEQPVNKCRRLTARLGDSTKSFDSCESDDEGVLSNYSDDRSV